MIQISDLVILNKIISWSDFSCYIVISSCYIRLINLIEQNGCVEFCYFYVNNAFGLK